jgi:hypothetical protein
MASPFHHGGHACTWMHRCGVRGEGTIVVHNYRLERAHRQREYSIVMFRDVPVCRSISLAVVRREKCGKLKPTISAGVDIFGPVQPRSTEWRSSQL